MLDMHNNIKLNRKSIDERKTKSVRLSKKTTLKENGHYRMGFDKRLHRQYKH